MNSMKMLKTTVPVLINFFNRPDQVKKVFEAVRQARPEYLFLSQDGARKGNVADSENIMLCRKIVENIDWDCKVYYNYSERNLGCGKRMSSAITWAFQYVERLIILEDDCVPSADFFKFSEILLERYKNDLRISMISAMNHLESYHNHDGDSYIFCNSGAIWAWATWKRQWELYDFNMETLKKTDWVNKIKSSSYPQYYKKDLITQGKNRIACLERGEKLSSWTFQYNMIRFLNHQLTIVPCENLISNVGLSGDSTHAVSSLKQMPKGLQSLFYMEGKKLEFPLRHPKYIYCDDEFDRKVWKKLGMNKGTAVYRKIEGIIRQIIFGDKKKLFGKFCKKIKG